MHITVIQNSFREPNIVLIFSFVLVFPAAVFATPYYYGMYKSFGTGDTVITTTHGNGGSILPHRKWQIECFDGEAATAIGDNIWDFGSLTYVWCKFLFPYKPPSNGLYPYYPHCHVRDYTTQFFCYVPQNHTLTVNTFVTGFWDSDFIWWTWSPTDVRQPYKCCRTPKGYYIDYVSCYYVPTHDLYWEYYDGNYFLVQCATGYVMAGVGSKINPIHKEKRIDWIQCCRIGWGAVIAVSPPIINAAGRPPAYSSSSVMPVNIPKGYAHQYRKKRAVPNFIEHAMEVGNNTVFGEEALTDSELPLYNKEGFDYKKHVTHYDVMPVLPEMNVPLSAQRL